MMVSVTGDNSERHTILSIDEAFRSDVFKAELVQGDYHFIGFDISSNLAKIVSAESLDIILPYVQDFGYSARNNLRVLITPEKLSGVVNQDILQNLDGIFPINSQYLMHQLKKLVKLQRRNHELKDGVDKLEADVAAQKRKSSEIELLKNAIVRNVSHELRTPLLQVKSAVALIGEDADDMKLVNYAQNAVSRLETHVKNITMLGHSLDINITPIILRDAIEYAKRNLTRTRIRKSDAEHILIRLDDNLPPVMADKQGLSTVLQLLMDNALKFGEGNDIEVIGRKSGDKVYIAVRDNGIGIASDQLQNIFESFYQVDDTSTRPYGGAGVGLALVKLILENHQVKISVDSTFNKGSTFWFELPYINFEAG